MFKTKFRQITCVTIVVITFSFSVAAHNKVVVVPLSGDDVVATDVNKVIFFTDSVYNGNLGGISGADDLCQDAADNASPALTGRFKAWLSDSTTPAVPLRSSFAKYDLPYVNVDGSLVANNFDDFTDGVFIGIIKSVSNLISNSTPNDGIWTGTDDLGNPTQSDCNGWTDSSGTAPFGTVGVANGGTGAGGRWSNAGFSYGCSNVARLYCFQQ